MNIAYIGYIFFCKKIGYQLEERGHKVKYLDYNDWGRKLIPSLKDVWEMDVIHFICAIGCRKYFYIFVIRYLLKKKIIVHFVGSDILRLKKVNYFDRLNWILALKSANRIFVGAPWHVDELNKYLKTESLILFFNHYEIERRSIPFPDQFTVLSYLPSGKPDFYGEKLIKVLIEKYPEIKFIILGINKFSHYPNVETIQIDYDLDMTEIYKQTSLLIRLTKHDGFSSMVLEALSLGRNVIWTYKIPHCFQTVAERDNLLNQFDRAREEIYNSSGADWVRNNFNFNNFINKLESLYVNPNYKFNPIVIK